MLLLTELEVHTRNICSDIQGVCVRSMRLESQNKYFPYEPKSRLIRALLYTYTNKIVYDEILLNWSVVYYVSALPGPYSRPYAYVRTASQPVRSKNSFRISISIQ